MRSRGQEAASQAEAKAAYATEMQRRDAERQRTRRPAHRPKRESVNSAKNDVNTSRPLGNSVDYALQKLGDDCPELKARVLAGELTANAAMVEAGFRKPRPRDPCPGLTKLRRAWKKATAEERAMFLAEIQTQ
jgi:hypothetical protein